MLFNSYIFVFLFLPIAVGGYFILNHRRWYKIACIFLVLMSLWFYGYFNPKYLMLMVVSILANWILSRAMICVRENIILKKILLWITLFIDIGLIFYFKYYNFFVGNINQIFRTNFSLINVILPLGISFFTFQQISFVVDSYHGETDKYVFWEYALFITYFPQLIAGPIVLHDEFIPQLDDESKRKFCWHNCVGGIYSFVCGMAKKVWIADTLGIVADYGFKNYGNLNSTSILLAIFAYTMQIYFDFSGYSDMAIGIGKMFNIELPINFNSPYKANNVVEFWKRWHITLTRFLRKYVYFPLGGGKKGTARKYLNIMVVFLVSGIWHGANWTFICWGLIHGIANVAVRMFENRIKKIPNVVMWILNFGFINMTWMLFKADSITSAVDMTKGIFTGKFGIIDSYMAQNMVPLELRTIFMILDFNPSDIMWMMLVICICLVLIFIVTFKRNVQENVRDFHATLKNAIAVSIMFWICIISFSTVSTFLYFNF